MSIHRHAKIIIQIMLTKETVFHSNILHILFVFYCYSLLVLSGYGSMHYSLTLGTHAQRGLCCLVCVCVTTFCGILRKIKDTSHFRATLARDLKRCFLFKKDFVYEICRCCICFVG